MSETIDAVWWVGMWLILNWPAVMIGIIFGVLLALLWIMAFSVTREDIDD